jgi:DNA-binding transcriptional regulator YhcF (GntR family)
MNQALSLPSTPTNWSRPFGHAVEDQPSVASTQSPAYRQITDQIRGRILQGNLTPGMRLPSTAQLAANWNASYFTVYTALQKLVKEGLIVRTRGSGSYVAEPENRFTCAGIYYSIDIFAGEQNTFFRQIHVALMQILRRMKIDVQIFIDPRPPEKQVTILPALADSILHRRIQCIIAPSTNNFSAPALERLAPPTAFQGNFVKSNRASFDMEGYLRESLRCLAAQDCRSVGVVSTVMETPGSQNLSGIFYHYFRQIARDMGLATREEWIRKPPLYTPHMERYGYKELKSLWRLREKPEGLIVYPDAVVRGAILAILELGIKVVPPQMKFVFHRNAHHPFLCPFPATWAISDENLLAEEMVRAITRQFKGQKNSSIPIPFSFVRDKK